MITAISFAQMVAAVDASKNLSTTVRKASMQRNWTEFTTSVVTA